MAYRRRRTYRARKRRRIIGPKMARAVKAIVRGQVETKLARWSIEPGATPADKVAITFSLNSTYLSLTTNGSLFNLMEFVPRSNNNDPSAQEVVGDEFMLQGIAVNLPITTIGNGRVSRVRGTIFQSSIYLVSSGSVAINYQDVFDNESNIDIFTFRPFDKRIVDVITTKTIEVGSAAGADYQFLKLWAPIKGKKKCANIESGTDPYVMELKDKNYYFLLEYYGAGLTTPSTTGNLQIFGDVKVYFKDA